MEEEGARLIHRPVLLTPLEAVGSGIEPEVKMHLAVDERGRVGQVDVLAVEPSSELDEVFRQSAIQQVSSWRFAPARRDGVAVESELVTSIKFLAASGDRLELGLDPLRLARSDPQAETARLWLLPPAVRQQIVERYSHAAERYLDAKRRRRVDSPLFVVITDSEDQRTAEVAAQNLEAIFNVLHGIFDPVIDPEPERYKIVAYLFARRSAFEAMREELRLDASAAGFYAPPGVLAFHLEESQDTVVSVMLHEATHAFVDRHVKKRGVVLPLWMEEGFAEYIGNSQITRKGELVPGKTVKRKLVMAHGGALRITTQAGWTLEQLKAAVRRGEAPPLREVLAASYSVFYGEHQQEHYALSWLFVHSLWHADDAWRERFPELMLYLAEGYAPVDAIESVYGQTLEQLESRFDDYVRRF